METITVNREQLESVLKTSYDAAVAPFIAELNTVAGTLRMILNSDMAMRENDEGEESETLSAVVEALARITTITREK